jgi:predicted NAD/FAD-binding protein
MTSPKSIAVIGGGMAGLTAAFLLSRKHKVTLFEKSGRLGGNAYSYKTSSGDEPDIAVAAFGMAGYQEFYALLKSLGVETTPCPNSYMSMHNLDNGAGLYLTPSLKGGLAQRFDVLKPANLKMLFQLVIGLKQAQKLLMEKRLTGLTFGQMLDRHVKIRDDSYLILLCSLCLMSSMSADEVLATPAEFFLNKLRVHNDVISPKAVYSVRCVKGGTKVYIRAMADSLKSSVKLNCQIRTVERLGPGIKIIHSDGKIDSFDNVVMACNADQALALLKEPTADEKRVLGVWKYKEGQVVVHRDHGSFPSRNLIQAYTFLYTNRNNRIETSVNGALWHEPHVDSRTDYISAQHPNYPIRDRLIDFDTVLRTPMFDSRSVAMQEELPKLNGVQKTYYCGSHFGFGLHNDAVASAMRVAEHFGVDFLLPEKSGLSGLGELFKKVASVNKSNT